MIQHYRIELSFDWTKRSVTGETTIKFQPLGGDLKEVEIDAGDMTIKAVKLAGGAALKYRYVTNEKLYVTLDRAYPAGQDVSIAIGYAATPKQGLTFITPSEADPTRPYQIWSQGEARTNHYWFPCYDYPNDKATAELIATADQKFRVISNGTLVTMTRNGTNSTWHWKMDRSGYMPHGQSSAASILAFGMKTATSIYSLLDSLRIEADWNRGALASEIR